MTTPLSIYNGTTNEARSQDGFQHSPLIFELENLFAAIPYKNLLDAMLSWRIRAFSPLGRFGYPLEALLRAVVASYYLPLKSTAQIVRRLQEDPVLAITCGFDPRNIPHRSTFSRFNKKLTQHQDLLDLCLNNVTSEVGPLLQEFGKVVAVDSTPVRSHCNPRKEPPSDTEAGWIAKGSSGKRKEWHFGYKLHIVADANHELPIGKELTPAKVSDYEAMLPLLRDTKECLDWFSPEVVIADKGYDSTDNYHGVVEEFGASPIIPLSPRSKNPMPNITGTPEAPICPGGLPLLYRSRDRSKGKIQYKCPATTRQGRCPMPVRCGLKMIWIREGNDYRRFGHTIKRGTDEYKGYYRKRVSVERVNSRLKQTRRLEEHCFRGFNMVNTHATLSVLVMQAVALAKAKAGQMNEIRGCVRPVG